ncbi:hypothetical protein [Ferrimonas marina]|uniref:hypothetical protein n=1 Tax=Ferrimonas marina TaxID=299255 RepID=UPI001160F6F9|nr:hypothetical protein [Ferrimonas marina]
METSSGSIRSIYPSLTIHNYGMGHLSNAANVNANAVEELLHYLSNNEKRNLEKHCGSLNLNHDKIYYGFDNVSISSRQFTEANVNYSGGKDWKFGQEVYIIYNFYCASL